MNRNRQPVNYRPLRLQTTIAEGLLPVARDGGELEERTAAIFRQLAGRAGQAADREAVRRGQADAEAAALAQAPQPGQMRASVAAPDDIRAVIEGAAQKYGVDAGALLKIAELESSFNPRAKNPSSSAGGLFQFIDGTARDYGLADRFDAGQASDAAARLLKDNAASLRKVLGRDPTAGELYLAHQQGAGGAAKLLRNPNARAVDVVGRDAVRLNGGREDMSAQEFANKWIAKASGAATVSGGKPGTWRPSGSGGLYGDAYDKAGAKVYLSQLNTTMLAEMDQLAERYGDDPVALERAMGELKQAHLQDHVFPEIAADYAVAFDRQAVGYVSDARNRAEKRAREAEQAEWLGRVNGLEETRSRFLAGLDPAAEGSEARLAAMQGEIDLQYDEAVRRGLWTPLQADEAKARSARAANLGFYMRQATGRSEAEIAAMREEIRQDYADGALTLDAEGFEQVDAALVKLARETRTETERARKDLEERGAAMVRRISAGFDVPDTELAEFALSAGADTPSAATARRVVEIAETAGQLRDMTVMEARDHVRSLREQAGRTPDDASVIAIEMAEKLLDQKEKAVAKDPLGYAERAGMVEATEIDRGDPDAITASLDARTAQARVASDRLGEPVPLFRPDEAARIKAGLNAGDVAERRAALVQLDYLAQQSGLAEVEAQFGKAGAEAVQDWQGKLRYASDEDVTRWLKEREDPKWRERVKPLLVEGAAEARKVAFEDLVSEFDPNWVASMTAPVDRDTEAALMEDFAAITGERYAALRDIDKAKEQAIERLGRIWGVTSAYGEWGGRLMAYPPERFYPEVAGSRDWIAAELASLASARNVPLERLSLVADGKTKAAADRNERPGYLLSVIDPETGLEDLLTDDEGRVLRHYFDPLPALEAARARAEEARRTQNDPWIVFSEDTAIGPFYPPWRPATAQDLKLRKQRLPEIAAERSLRMQKWNADKREKLKQVQELMNDAERP